MTSITEILAAAPDDATAPAAAGTAAVGTKYLIAFTPRSGSSYLCERLERTGVAGIPREILNKDLMPIVLKQIPARTPLGYLDKVLSVRVSPQGVSGFKTTWFQFTEYSELLPSAHDWAEYRFIYLRRDDLALQAVSLYRAVSSNVFHTNIPVDGDAERRMAELPYQYEAILRWYEHIAEQEQAWERYFAARGLAPLRLSYEAVYADVSAVVQSILGFVGVEGVFDAQREPSVFRKLGNATSEEWAERFAQEALEVSGTSVRRCAEV